MRLASHFLFFRITPARVVELVDTQDLKSCGQQWLYGFNSRPGYSTSLIIIYLYQVQVSSLLPGLPNSG